jgi:hypothetical protein
MKCEFFYLSYSDSPDKVYIIKNNQITCCPAASLRNIPGVASEIDQKAAEDDHSDSSNHKLKKGASENSVLTNNENTHSLPRGGCSDRIRKLSPYCSSELLTSMPHKPLQMICHLLSLKDMCALTWTNKRVRERMMAQDMVWKVKIFKLYEVRVGYQHIRNVNLLRIDTIMKPLQKEALKFMLDGKWNQKLIIIIWFLGFLSMALIAFPLLLIMDEEGINIPTAIIFLPFTLCWIALMICTSFNLFIANKTKKKLLERIWNFPDYWGIPKVRGRKFEHPVFWSKLRYLSKALMVKCLFLIGCYWGIFAKTTIYDEMSYLTMILISWIPIAIVILIKEMVDISTNMKTKRMNEKKLRPHLRNAVNETITTEIDFDFIKKLQEDMKDEKHNIPIGDPREIKYKEIRSCLCLKRRKTYFSYGDQFKVKNDKWFDMSLLHSIALPNLIVGGFLVLCALRLDDTIGLNWFIITIPTWFFIIPIAILTILHGIWSQNRNVTLFEKIVISSLVPIGFISSYILCLLKLEGYNDWKFSIIFIPNFVSVIAFYIYTRQLRTVKIVPKQEESKEINTEEAKQEHIH